MTSILFGNGQKINSVEKEEVIKSSNGAKILPAKRVTQNDKETLPRHQLEVRPTHKSIVKDSDKQPHDV